MLTRLLLPPARLFAFIARSTPALLQLERVAAGLRRRRVQIDGHAVQYLEGGHGDAIVLLHGFGSSSDLWPRFARHLRHDRRVIAPDLPGFGESSRLPNASYSVERQAERIIALADALGLAQFDLVGSSMGGYIAAFLAAHYPERLRSLALIGAVGVEAPVLSPFFRNLAAGENTLIVDDPQRYPALLALVYAKAPTPPRFMLNYFARRAFEQRHFNRKVFDELWRQQRPLQPLLPAVQARTLLLWGDQDQIADPSSIPLFQQGLQQAPTSTVILPGVGHLPMQEQPRQSANHYRAFLGLPPT